MSTRYFTTKVVELAEQIADLNTDPSDNPEYYRGQLELAATMLPGDNEQLAELLGQFVTAIHTQEEL